MEYKFIHLSPPSVWSTPLGLPGRCGICMHKHSASGLRRRKRITTKRRHCTYWHMAQYEGRCGLTSLMACVNHKKIRDIRERNVTIRSEIWTTNIHSLEFQDIREWVILYELILQTLGVSHHKLVTREGRGSSHWIELIPSSMTVFVHFILHKKLSSKKVYRRHIKYPMTLNNHIQYSWSAPQCKSLQCPIPALYLKANLLQVTFSLRSPKITSQVIK